MKQPNFARIVSGMGLGLVLGACSFVVEFEECRTSADCEGTGEPLTCDEGVCIGTQDFPTCTSHQVCATAFGSDFLCGSQGVCISALTDECTRVVWPEGVSRDKVVFIGSLIPVSPPYDAITVPLQNAIELAINDFNQTTVLPGGRRIAWIACDDRGLVDVAERAAKHLAVDVAVPAIIGPIFSEEVLQIADSITVPAGTLLISPTASNSTISNLDDNNLVWRTIPSDVYQSSAIADRILLDLDPKPASVVVLVKDDAYGNGLVERIVPDLESSTAVKVIAYDDPTSYSSEADLLSAYGLVISGAFEAKPDTILLLGTSEVAVLLGTYVKIWGELTPEDPLPRFILSHGGVAVMEDAVNQFEDPALRQLLMTRVEGTAPIIQDPENFNAYNVRYKIRFDDEEALTTSSLSYDATLVVMFAMATAGNAEITGSRIASGITRLVDKDGADISFGGSDLGFIKTTVDTLAIGTNVDLQGVSGELDFDLSTGEVRTNIVGWDLAPKSGTADIAALSPARVYVLNPIPAVDGTWVPL